MQILIKTNLIKWSSNGQFCCSIETVQHSCLSGKLRNLGKLGKAGPETTEWDIWAFAKEFQNQCEIIILN